MFTKFFNTLLILLSFFVLGYSQSQNIHEKIDASLMESYNEEVQQEYILILKSKAILSKKWAHASKNEKAQYVFKTLKNHALVTQKPIVEWLKNKNIEHQSFFVTNAIKVVSTKKEMLLLAQREDIQYVIHDKPFYMLNYSEEKSQSLRSPLPEWGILNMKADSVWQMGYEGQGVVIAGQDTGYDWQLGPIKTKYRGYINDSTAQHNFNWHDAIHINNPAYADTLINPCGFNSTQPCDDHNHGTHTMGTMVGQDDESIIGVAPRAQWIACRNMDRGWGQPSTYMECFEWFLAPYDYEKQNYNPSLAPHVINNSWYCSESEGCNTSNFYLMENIVNNLKAAGIVVVVSAGNTGQTGCGSISGPPAFFENSFTVGATGINDTIGNFSSIGPVIIDGSYRLKPDVTAPGVGVRSLIRGGAYRTWSGTSMAGPHVAGLVALMISANPKLAGQVDEIENIIRSTARPRTTNVKCEVFNDSLSLVNPVYGYGIINAYAAVKRALEYIPTSTQSFETLLTIYPNPTDAYLVIQSEDISLKIKNVKIHNLQGQQMMNFGQKEDSTYEILDLQMLSNGVYFIEVSTSNGPLVKKFIKI